MAAGDEVIRSTRPLRTGTSFVVVVPDTRVVQLRWDRAAAKPGSDCQLLVEGKGLDALEARLERRDERGVWEEVARLELAADASGAKANGTWTLPVAAPARPAGCFVSASWERAAAAPGEEIALRATANGLDEGAFVAVVVERWAGEDGFVPVERWQSSLEGGAVETKWRVRPYPAEAAPPGEIHAVRPDATELAAGEMAWVSIDTEGLDGSCLQVFLERRDEASGRWDLAGQATSQVRSGQARAGISPPRRGSHG
jgi:hypothetical protein